MKNVSTIAISNFFFFLPNWSVIEDHWEEKKEKKFPVKYLHGISMAFPFFILVDFSTIPSRRSLLGNNNNNNKREKNGIQ